MQRLRSQNGISSTSSRPTISETSTSRSSQSNDSIDENPKNWQEFEVMLGNCCDRVLHEIDDRFKSLAEYLWDEIDQNCATPETIHIAFKENFKQIDDYLKKQFAQTKLQLDQVLQMEKTYPRPRPRDKPGGGPNATASSISNCDPSEPSPRPKVRRSMPNLCTRPLSVLDDCDPPSRQPRRSVTARDSLLDTAKRKASLRRQPSSLTSVSEVNEMDALSCGDGGSAVTSEGTSYWPEQDRRPCVEPTVVPVFTTSKSLTSLFPKIPRAQSLFTLGMLAGILTALVLLYLSPHLPPAIRQYLPFHANPTLGRYGGPAYFDPRSDASFAHRRKPYDAFWSSCGSSFLDWWSFTKNLFFN